MQLFCEIFETNITNRTKIYWNRCKLIITQYFFMTTIILNRYTNFDIITCRDIYFDLKLYHRIFNKC